MDQNNDSSNVSPVLAVSSGPKDANNSTSPTSSTWRSYFRWFAYTTIDESAESERSLLENYGHLPISTDPLHVQSRLVSLTAESTMGDRFINTLIVDAETVNGGAQERCNVVMCHGFGAGLGFFYRNLQPLSQAVPNGRIFAIDLLGMGRSGRPDFPKFDLNATQGTQKAVDFFLDSMEEWRQKQEGLERFVLVGHSMGGYLSALYALRHPERVEKLILASPGRDSHRNHALTRSVGLPEQIDEGITVTGHKIPAFLSRLWNANYTPQGLIRGLGPLGRRFAYGYCNGRFPYLPLPERETLARYFYHISSHIGSGEYALAALLAPGAWAREPLHSRLALLTMPTTFIYGVHDWMDKRHAEAAAQQMSVPVKIVSVPDAGHHLHMDNPSSFNQIVADAINS